MAQGFEPEEGSVVLRCPKCETENPSDSIFCRICGEWLVRQWEAVLIKGRTPITSTMKLAPGDPATVLRKRILSRTHLEVHLEVLKGGRRDVIAWVQDPNGNTMAGNMSQKLRGAASLSCETYVPGEYQVILDNSFSRFSCKVVAVRIAGF